jgi:hypothetical protein
MEKEINTLGFFKLRHFRVEFSGIYSEQIEIVLSGDNRTEIVDQFSGQHGYVKRYFC